MTTPSLRERSCPVCGGEGRVYDAHVDVEHARYGLAADAVPLRRCASCGMRFFDLIEGVNTHGEVYASMTLSASLPKRRHRLFARLLPVLGARGLELGSGACHVGRLVGSEVSVTAVDANPQCDGAPAHLEFVDANITALEDSAFPAESFDWVLIDNVLEHLPSFVDLLAQARRWLKAEGRIVVSVPNGRTLRRHLGGRHLREVFRPVEHVNIFDPATLDGAFARVDCIPTRAFLLPKNVFEVGAVSSLLGWAPFGLYRAYRKVSAR